MHNSASITDLTTGALDGIPRDERQRRRLIHKLHEYVSPKLSMGDADTSPMMPASYSSSEEPQLSGTDVEVDILPTHTGIALRRKDNGQQLTERRTLSQDELSKLPRNAEKYKFANLRARSGEIYSCIIVQPGNEVFGSMRAFWWSLAAAIVSTTVARANGTQMTKQAHAIVCGNARGMWLSAIERTPIADMRDLIMPLRNVHFEVINKLADRADSEAKKLGLEIALAMVMAVRRKTTTSKATRIGS